MGDGNSGNCEKTHIFFLFFIPQHGYKPWKQELWLQPLNHQHVNYQVFGRWTQLQAIWAVATAIGYDTISNPLPSVSDTRYGMRDIIMVLSFP